MARQSFFKNNKKFKLLMIAGIFVLFVEIMLYTWCQVQFRATQYEFADTRRELAAQNFTQDNLKIELARLRSPERIMAIAKEKTGLVIPSARQFVELPQ